MSEQSGPPASASALKLVIVAERLFAERGLDGVSLRQIAASLHIEDTPIGYSPAFGSDVRVNVLYNQRRASQPTALGYTNFGPQFDSNWTNFYIAPITNVMTVYTSGGSYLVMTHVPGVYPGNRQRGETFEETGVHVGKSVFPDGSEEYYEHIDENSGVAFLSRTRDAQGNETTIQYDVNYQTRIDQIIADLRKPLTPPPSRELASGAQWVSNRTQAEYEEMVRQSKEFIACGDIFQVVLSQRLSRPTEADPFTIYRALRMLNPSPYMFFLDFQGVAGTGQAAGDGSQPLRIIGSSPEMHVRLEDGHAHLHPIAGTRWRGKTEEEDAALAAELLTDPKELAEHVMLVDLGRNDLGRISEYGTVTVPVMMAVERYSHVMHIVSDVRGKVRPEHDAFSLLRATFPAGTLSGAPKVRAMEIIEELEGVRRGVYGGAVGYIDYRGQMDTCIAIRTMVMQGKMCHLQAGGGIVADSDPTYEFNESMNKLKAVAVAVEQAERGI